MNDDEQVYSFVVPWSGEVIPIPVEPPPVGPLPNFPPSLPSPDPIIQFIGQGEHAIWDDVWSWIKGASSDAVNILTNTEATIANAVLGTVETYVGNQLKAISGFINGAYDYALNLANVVNTFAVDAVLSLYADVVFIDEILRQLLDDVRGIDDFMASIFPAVLGQVIDLLAGDILSAIGDVETWAIDNIYNPLDAEIQRVEGAVDGAILGAVADVEAYVRSLVNSETLARIAAIAGIAAIVETLLAEAEACNQPICDLLGPKTDLGKLLKALNAALLTADLVALLAMDEHELEGLISQLVTRGGQAIMAFDDFFVGGTETIGDVIGNL